MKKFALCRILAGGMALAVLAGAGCASQQEGPYQDEDGHVYFKRPDKVVYEQIPTIGCKLAPVGTLDAVAGTPFELDLMLTNASKRNVIIQEWYMIDQYNFAVYYRRLPEDRPVDAHTPFQCYQVHIPQRPQPIHSELRLAPGERAELTVKLPFVGDLNPGESAAFEVYVATSLETFKVKSELFTVIAR